MMVRTVPGTSVAGVYVLRQNDLPPPDPAKAVPDDPPPARADLE
jgi:hypothetical protein